MSCWEVGRSAPISGMKRKFGFLRADAYSSRMLKTSVGVAGIAVALVLGPGESLAVNDRAEVMPQVSESISMGTTSSSVKSGKKTHTVLRGWNSDRLSVVPGKRIKDRVRIDTRGKKRKRTVILLRARAKSNKWSQVWQRRTSQRGGLNVKFTAPFAGSWEFRLQVKGLKGKGALQSANRRISISPGADPTKQPTRPARDDSTLVYVAGDIGFCGGAADKTAKLIDRDKGVLVAPGDLEQSNGTIKDYRKCYIPHYGKFKKITYPVPGNHEYFSAGSGYFDYFGSRVGTPEAPWYSVDIGGWRFYMLNSNCSQISGCGVDSPQYKWLEEQMAAGVPQCTVAVWHHPRWSSGMYGSDAQTDALYRLLYANGTDLLLTGHEHVYERFAPKAPDGALSTDGIRQFTVATGGMTLRDFYSKEPGSQVRLNDDHGVMELRLSAAGYDWDFRPVKSGSQTDAGSSSCN